MTRPRSSSSGSGGPTRPEPFPRRLARLARRILFICLILGLVTGSSFCAWRMYRFMAVSDYYKIREFRIRCDGDELKKDALGWLDRNWVKTGKDNLFKLDCGVLEMELGHLPRVKSALVSKIYPATLKIDFVERHPVMIALLDDPYLMDADGVLLAKVSAAEMRRPRLPILTGIHVQKAHAGDKLKHARLTDILGTVTYIRDNEPLLSKMIVEWSVNTRAEVTAILNTHAEVLFGESPPIELLAKLVTGLQMEKELENKKIIDLRFDKQLVYR